MISPHYLKVVVYFLVLTELMRFSVEVLCCEVFMFFSKDLMDFVIRSGKSLSLGMPKAPQYNTRTTKSLSLGMPRKASPLMSSSIGNFT